MREQYPSSRVGTGQGSCPVQTSSQTDPVSLPSFQSKHRCHIQGRQNTDWPLLGEVSSARPCPHGTHGWMWQENGAHPPLPPCLPRPQTPVDELTRCVLSTGVCDRAPDFLSPSEDQLLGPALGSTVTLNCTAWVVPGPSCPQPSVQWLKDGLPLGNGSDYSLHEDFW